MRKLNILLIIVSLLAFSCIGTSHREKATLFNSIYNAQYDDYKVVAAQPNLSEEQREILRTKKRIFDKLWEPLKTYSKYADTGQKPSRETETLIIKLINQLHEQEELWKLK